MNRPSVRYHGKIVYLMQSTMIPNVTVTDQDLVLFTGDGQFARDDGGWTRIEPAVYEKIVSRDEVEHIDSCGACE